MVGDALGDRQPHRIGREHQRPMFAEGSVNRRQERLVARFVDDHGVTVIAALDLAAEHFSDRLMRTGTRSAA
jgi:hypothetical protein